MNSASRRPDYAPATVGDLRKLMGRIKVLETQLSEAYEAIAQGDDAQKEFWDEHEDKINRMGRRIKRMEDHTHADD